MLQMHNPVPYGVLVLDLKAHTVTTAHGSTYLRPKHFSTAVLLAAQAPELVSMDDVIDWLWGHCADGGPECADNCTRVYVAALRKSLDPLGLTVPNKFGRGWSLEFRDQARAAA